MCLPACVVRASLPPDGAVVSVEWLKVQVFQFLLVLVVQGVSS